MTRSYLEMLELPTFLERFQYLKLSSKIGTVTYGWQRYLNQKFYSTDKEWLEFREFIIIRDRGCDLAIPDRPIDKFITVHHINPITYDDILNRNPCLFDSNNVVCTTDITHKGIHYGDENTIVKDYVPRQPYDTCPWKH